MKGKLILNLKMNEDKWRIEKLIQDGESRKKMAGRKSEVNLQK